MGEKKERNREIGGGRKRGRDGEMGEGRGARKGKKEHVRKNI